MNPLLWDGMNAVFVCLTVVLLILLLVVALISVFWQRKKMKKKCTISYSCIFCLGVIFVIIGVVTDKLYSLIIGFILIVLGLANRERWNKPIFQSNNSSKNNTENNKKR